MTIKSLNTPVEEIARGLSEAEMLRDLAGRLLGDEKPKRLKFGLYKDEGWVTASSANTIRLLCDVWNNRRALGLAVRTHLEREGGGNG